MRERGEIQEWLQFFLTGVEVQANDAVARAEQLVDLRETYRSRTRRPGGARFPEVIDLVFANPIITAQRVAANLDITENGAKNLINGLADHGILTEIEPTRSARMKRWIGHEVLQILDPD